MSAPVSCLFLNIDTTPGHSFKKSRKLIEERKGASRETVRKVRIRLKPPSVEASESKLRNVNQNTIQPQVSN